MLAIRQTLSSKITVNSKVDNRVLKQKLLRNV